MVTISTVQQSTGYVQENNTGIITGTQSTEWCVCVCTCRRAVGQGNVSSQVSWCIVSVQKS